MSEHVDPPLSEAARRRRRRRRRRSGWTEAHVRRLWWRAGFGATPAEARHWARKGKTASIRYLTRARSQALAGPAPKVGGKPLDPENEYGHDVLWWLDRMVRTRAPLVEKMTLFWHDHFATIDQDTPLMLKQNRMLRKHCLGRFRTLLRQVTTDDAMLLFLSLADSEPDAPNENFARELMELFTLGSGYSENDIRQAALALTGFETDYGGAPDYDFLGTKYNPERHYAGSTKIFGKRGSHDWKDVLELCIRHRSHAPFLCTKLWLYFVTDPPSKRQLAALVRTYRRSGYKIRPVVESILASPALYRRLGAPDMVKSPVMFVAGMLRSTRTFVNQEDWTWLLDSMGMRLFGPPSVAGWDWGPAWLSTNSMRARFVAANRLFDEDGGRLHVKEDSQKEGTTAAQALAEARKRTGSPWTSRRTDAALSGFAQNVTRNAEEWETQVRLDMRQRVLRHFLLSGPDAQVH